MGIAHAGADLHPWLCLPVDIDPGGISLIVGIVHDAPVVEESDASVIVQPVPAAAYRQIVFLPE